MPDLTGYLESLLQPRVSKVIKDDDGYILEMPIKLEWHDYIDPDGFEELITYMEYQIIKEVEKYFPNGLKYRIKRK